MLDVDVWVFDDGMWKYVCQGKLIDGRLEILLPHDVVDLLFDLWLNFVPIYTLSMQESYRRGAVFDSKRYLNMFSVLDSKMTHDMGIDYFDSNAVKVYVRRKDVQGVEREV